VSQPPILHLGFPPNRLTPEQIEAIRTLAPGMEVLLTEDRGAIEAVLDRIEIAVRRFPRDLIARA